MDPITAVGSVSKLAATEALDPKIPGIGKPVGLEISDVASIRVVEVGMLRINVLVDNIPVGVTESGLFRAPEFRSMELIERPDIQGIEIHFGDNRFEISLGEDGFLNKIGAVNLVQYGLEPAVDTFLQLRLEQLKDGKTMDVVKKIEGEKIVFPTETAVSIRMKDANELMQELEKVSEQLNLDKRGILIARRVDYLVGDLYIPGRICDLPIVGGISNIIFKKKLEQTVTGGDWAKLVSDGILVVSVAVVPLAIAGKVGMLGWSAINGGFFALNNGVTAYLKTESVETAVSEAGKGALIGTVTGLAGGLAAAKIAPMIPIPWVSSAASGAAVGSVSNVAVTTLRVIENGESIAEAAKQVGVAAATGAAGGAALGAGFYGLTRGMQLAVAKVDNSLKAARFERTMKGNEVKLPETRNVHMGDINQRARLINENMDDFAAHVMKTDPGFQKEIARFGEKMAEARRLGDQAAINRLETQLQGRLSGRLSEAQVKTVFEPYFDKISTQKFMPGKEGNTFVDMVLEGAKRPIAITRHRFVEKGGMLPIEVKAASERYFRNELEKGHLQNQLSGHVPFGKGLVVTTKDINNVATTFGEAREVLRSQGAALYRILPEKAHIEQAIRNLVS
jgi:hypothetical protein